ncbi:hypothetical protein PP178_02830 [Zeaxanthinibacter sp. PT1]|uniref:hypothetical protein n=1 Tax=Zeaxanthinibacter TaxID=561554 RepID=UPI00234B4A6D|nr:hypothetical protein [Zeaxanthinibacter sp. PT1]MDC6350471.1 hypothetical protein [Zeaxanthinibacter sp. PT1]
MKKEYEILKNLSPAQRREFEKDLENIYSICYEKTKGELSVLKDVTVNMNLCNEVYLNVTFEFNSEVGESGKGRITALTRYPNKLAYEAAVAAEKHLN